jgi:sensor c-di-GMP phosphodiesterase-like protein
MGALLVAAALSGYLLGGCAGDDLEGLSGATELPTLSLPEVTVPEVTVPDVTLPEITVPTRPEPETTTSEPTTTTKPPITTEPATTVVKTETETATETETVTETVPTETAVAAPTLAETTSAETSDEDTPWGWIALALGLLIAAVTLGIVLWRRRNDEGSE